MRIKLCLAVALFGLLASAVTFAAAKTIIYFTADDVPTAGEKATIATLTGQAAVPYRVVVRSSPRARLRHTRETADYLAGAIPPNYRDGGVDVGTPLATVYSPTDPPNPAALADSQAIARNGATVHIQGGGSATLYVAGSVAKITTYTKPDGGP